MNLRDLQALDLIFADDIYFGDLVVYVSNAEEYHMFIAAYGDKGDNDRLTCIVSDDPTEVGKSLYTHKLKNKQFYVVKKGVRKVKLMRNEE